MYAFALMKRASTAAVVALLVTALAAGCGAQSAKSTKSATLVLDFTPNAVHTGIYTARKHNFYSNRGVKLRVREPSSSADALKLLQTGRADFAILDIHDLGIARQKEIDVVAVMALVEKPLAAILSLRQSGVENPKQLEGKRVGVTGVPSDDAVLDSIVTNAGGNPDKVKKVTIGFNAVGSLIAGKVAGATAFWNAEGVGLRRHGQEVREFRVDRYGAPSYPELVLVTARRTLEKNPDLVRSVVGATKAGYKLTLSNPKESLRDLLSEVKGLNKGLMRAQLDSLLPAFEGDAPSLGYLDPKVLRAWSRWDVRFGILKEKPDVAEAFTNRFLPGG